MHAHDYMIFMVNQGECAFKLERHIPVYKIIVFVTQHYLGTHRHVYIRDCKVTRVGKIYFISEPLLCKVTQGTGNALYFHDRLRLNKHILGKILIYVNV